MKSENKVKKLVLKKETLRDLTPENAGEIKGGGTAWCVTHQWQCHVHGKTYNKKCGH